MIPSFCTKLFVFFLWMMVSSLPALAQSTELKFGAGGHDSNLPVEITSLELVLDQTDGSAIFSGDVVIRQGAMVLKCGMVRVEYNASATAGEDRITAIRMSEGVTFASDGETAESGKAVYSPSEGLLVMTGSVLIVQGVTAISADRLDYDLVNGTGRVQGNVRTVLRLNEN